MKVDLTNKSQCVYCKKQLPEDRLLSHVHIHHKAVALRCTFSQTCRSYFLSNEDRERHNLEVHLTGKLIENRKCSCCSKEFQSFYELKQHALNIHGESLLKCSIKKCPFISNSSEKVTQHLQDAHVMAEKLKLFSCKICNFKTKFKLNIRTHTLRMHGTEKLKCKLCLKNNYFKSRFSLNIHVESVHNSKKSNVICIHCNLSVLQLSLAGHVAQRPCKLCNVIFNCFGLMQKHRLKCRG